MYFGRDRTGEFSVNSQTVSGQLLNAAPGLFFAVGGIVANIVAVWKGVQISFQNGGDEQHYQTRSTMTGYHISSVIRKLHIPNAMCGN